MNSNSQETLRRIEQNDAGLSLLWINSSGFQSSDASDYSRLGAAIGNNTHLRKLNVALYDEDALEASNIEFFDGLKRNSSISDLQLNCRNQTLIGGVGHEILKSYQKNNNNLTSLCIKHAVLDNGGGDAIADTLRWCRNLKTISLTHNSITDEQLLPMIDAIRGHRMLENLYLFENRIGNAGCHALATLLADTNSNLQILSLFRNNINNEGATAIGKSLANNTKLKRLYLYQNQFDQSVVLGIFCTVLCNTSSVNDTYSSNHMLDTLVLSVEQQGQHANNLATFLKMNEETNKSHVAIKKILKYHPNIDMKPLFEWDSDGEQTLKALPHEPHVVDWFERAKEAVADDGDREGYHVEQRQLSAIFQFAKAMPLLFVQPSNTKEDDKKRKRIDM